MTPTQFRTAITALNLNPTAAGLALGVDQRTVRRYLDGTRAIPRTVEILLTMYRVYGSPALLLEPPPAPSGNVRG